MPGFAAPAWPAIPRDIFDIAMGCMNGAWSLDGLFIEAANLPVWPHTISPVYRSCTPSCLAIRNQPYL